MRQQRGSSAFDRGSSRTVRPRALEALVLVLGTGFLTIGLSVIVTTGFSPARPFRPQSSVVGLQHTPALALGEVLFGVALFCVFTLAGAAPRLARVFTMLLCSTCLACGAMILVGSYRDELEHWIVAVPQLGWVYTVVGAVGTAVSMFTRPRLRGREVGSNARARHSESQPIGSDRVLATVLFTDIVASTRQAAAVGDRRWRRLLDHHDAVTRSALERFHGYEVRRTGDGFLATFDSPALAVRCADAAIASLRPAGVQLRVGVHAGEVELRSGGIDGIAVHIGARVCARAEPGEILVSRTVKDATVGSGLQFVDRGEHELRGVPERWQLYAART
jgi:class 3 adenylate cyclase